MGEFHISCDSSPPSWYDHIHICHHGSERLTNNKTNNSAEEQIKNWITTLVKGCMEGCYLTSLLAVVGET